MTAIGGCARATVDMTIKTVSAEQVLRRRAGNLHARFAPKRGAACGLGYSSRRRRRSDRVPLLYWLSGLTCTEENFIVKAGAQRVAAELGLAIVVPDTSPRGLELTRRGRELRLRRRCRFLCRCHRGALVRSAIACIRMSLRSCQRIIAANFPIDASRAGIFGHSMGGHGALTIALKNPDAYKSAVSAFAPICSPMRCPWGEKALAGYLGSRSHAMARVRYDSAARGPRLERTAASGRPGDQGSVPG